MSTERTDRRAADRREQAPAGGRAYSRRIDCEAREHGFTERRGGSRGRGDAHYESRPSARHLD